MRKAKATRRPHAQASAATTATTATTAMPLTTTTTTTTTVPALDHDAWSHIIPFLAGDAWTTAMDMVRITKTCRLWKSIPVWTYYTHTFGIFSFVHMPGCVKSLMRAAAERHGFVNQKTAGEHLKLTGSNLKHVAHKTIRLGMGRKMYLYDVGDVLRVATERFTTVDKLEKHILKCNRLKQRRLESQQAKDQRWQDVQRLLRDMHANFIVTNHLKVKEIDDYVDKNRGSIDDIRRIASKLKEKYDKNQARLRLIKERQAQYREWVNELRLSHHKYLDLDIVRRFIYDGVGTQDEIVLAVQQQFAADQERVKARMQLAPGRKEQLKAELAAHGLALRSDSQFCNQYIRGETTASLQEVVATMKLTSFLFGFGHRTWSRWHRVLEFSMRIKMQTEQFLNWYAACENVIQTNRDSIANEDNSDDSDYY